MLKSGFKKLKSYMMAGKRYVWKLLLVCAVVIVGWLAIWSYLGMNELEERIVDLGEEAVEDRKRIVDIEVKTWELEEKAAEGEASSRIAGVEKEVAELKDDVARMNSGVEGGMGAGGGLGVLESMCLGVRAAFTEDRWERNVGDPETIVAIMELLYRTGEISDVAMREWLFLQMALPIVHKTEFKRSKALVEALDQLCWGETSVIPVIYR